MTCGHVWTIGHSNNSIDSFIHLLENHRITAIADVRSIPYSRAAPQFRRESLRASLRNRGMSYVFLGRELGARSKDLSCYEDGRVVYERLAQTAEFQGGIERVLRGIKVERLALMCAERDPLDCHRTLLVARALVHRNVQVDHILATGEVEEHDKSILRLVDRLEGNQLDLFSTLDEQIRVALQLQERRIAYVDRESVRTQSSREL